MLLASVLQNAPRSRPPASAHGGGTERPDEFIIAGYGRVKLSSALSCGNGVSTGIEVAKPLSYCPTILFQITVLRSSMVVGEQSKADVTECKCPALVT
ncbi:hypothetical protein EVAR_47756_1 [Eumeta japonica]|uniref:Uncharacterized protein n=1 Tax=Eumeta variegata TaxID=151549 RepID=A0A4C1VUP1_EUMVA|nr:hypothetical protein EVAR_47756_1 [Eumeta japonica]